MGVGIFTPVPRPLVQWHFDVIPQLRGWYCNGQGDSWVFYAMQLNMLSHRGIIGNMTTYGENIMSSVSVTVAQRRKQYVVTGFFLWFPKGIFFFFSSRLGYAHLSHRLYG